MATHCPIFISYRRADLSLEAEWLHALITTFFGEGVAFFDRREITAGTRWDDTLEQAIRNARLVLVLIGPAWLKVQLPSGMRRLDDPEDWVRREVATAMEVFAQQPGRTRVFPVLVNGAAPIPRDWLPPALADLASFQWEPALQFELQGYLEHAADIHAFLADALRPLLKESPLPGVQPRPFRREQVPSPYDVAGYPLPEALRLKRPEHPYKGLAHFGREDAAIFFGRHREIAEIIDVFRKGRNFLRLFGPTGTGKSSLLFAGLLPRLEGRGWRLAYRRRDVTAPAAQMLDEAVQSLAAGPDDDALVILDQVEEILTAPNPAAPTELQDLVAAAARVEALNASRNRPIRLLWAYRKEYDGNLKAALREGGLGSAEYWLRNLDADGMREAVNGIVRDQDLQAEYRLEIEPGLDRLIVDELLARSAAESVTPLLQMLLRRLWDRALAEGGEKCRFTQESYEACKNTDLLKLVQEQMDAVAADGSDGALHLGVTSGLALDLLERLVSDQDTCQSLPQDELTGCYAQPSAAARLVQALVDRYLLVRDDARRCRLPHDTLARAVRLLHARSALPGQRASRLLESKSEDIRLKPESVDFSLTDLRTLDEGLAGMRQLTPAEQLALDTSRQRRQQEQLTLQQKNEQLAEALIRAERDLARAQVAELRGLRQRLLALAAAAPEAAAAPRRRKVAADPATDAAPAGPAEALQDELQQIETRLATAQRAHQAMLARAIGFRGDFEFLMRWEGVAGSVKMLGDSAYIDPLTDLARADATVIRARYEFLLSPAELKGVVALAGLKGGAAQQAFDSHPVIARIRLTAADVAQLIPDVLEPWWHDLLRRNPDLAAADTPPQVHTALLSLAANVGLGSRLWAPLKDALAARNWAALADAIESLPMPGVAPGLKARRREEAALIRSATAAPPGISGAGGVAPPAA